MAALIAGQCAAGGKVFRSDLLGAQVFDEAQIRVHLYGQPTDMRKYARRSVMRGINWLRHGYPLLISDDQILGGDWHTH
jgi:hypothetical protein